jgi:hypothetical protein
MPAQPSRRATAIILAACAVLMLLAMLHHPVAGAGADRAAAIMAVGRLSGIVHGSLIVLILIVLGALQRVGDELRALGIDPRAGLLALAVSIAGYVIAASINGFVIPQIAQQAHSLEEPQRAAFPLIAQALFDINQYCTVVATLALGVGLIAWSVPLAGSRLRSARASGIVGVLAGLVMIGVMLAGTRRVNVTLMTEIVGGFGLWLVSLAVWLLHPAPAATAKPAS